MKLSGEHLQRQLRGFYRVEQKIGQGGMGEVWAARDLALACPVAIKVLNASLSDDGAFVHRFEQEMRTQARLRYKRIAQVLTAGRLVEDGRLFMVMERLRGQTMREQLAEMREGGEVLDPGQAAYRAYQILDALAVAHAAGIVHRDVKPDNVMVDAEGELKLLDFGVAKVVEATGPLHLRAGRERISTSTSTVLGTARYVAPERIAGLGGDARGDLYAVGIMLLHELTGEYPYPVDVLDEAAVLRAHLEMAPVVHRERNPDCPPELWALALKLVAKDPSARWQTALEVRDVLSSLIRGSMLPEELRHPVVPKVVAEHKEGVLRAVVQESARRRATVRAARVEPTLRAGDDEHERTTLLFGTRIAVRSANANAGAEEPEGTARLGTGFVVKSPCAEGPEGTTRLGTGFVAKSPHANVTRPMHVMDVRALRVRPERAAPVKLSAAVEPVAQRVVAARVAPQRVEPQEAVPAKAALVSQRVEPVLARPRARRAEVMVTVAAGLGVIGVLVAVVWRSASATVVTLTAPSTTVRAMVSAAPSATVTAAPSAMVTAAPSATVMAAPSATAPVPSAAVPASAKAAPSTRSTGYAPVQTKLPPLAFSPEPEPKRKLPPLPFPPQ